MRIVVFEDDRDRMTVSEDTRGVHVTRLDKGRQFASIITIPRRALIDVIAALEGRAGS